MVINPVYIPYHPIIQRAVRRVSTSHSFYCSITEEVTCTQDFASTVRPDCAFAL
jgi:hypothetical protein